MFKCKKLNIKWINVNFRTKCKISHVQNVSVEKIPNISVDEPLHNKDKSALMPKNALINCLCSIYIQYPRTSIKLTDGEHYEQN